MIAYRKIVIEFLHLFVLVAFAVAQPIYDLLGKNPEFFVAHSAKPALIINMILVLSLGLSLVLVLGELAARFFGERVRCGVHWLFVFVLVVVIAMPLMKRMNASDFLIVGSAVLFGLLFTVLYARLPVVRMFMTGLLPATLVFPLWFVWATPGGRLLTPQVIETDADIAITNTKPVVVVVFDEFTTTALLDAEGQIDSVRFPNFAALAAESWWYPNAVAPYFSTNQSVPSILTGRTPRPEMKLAPTASNYPQNLFTMLKKQYRLNVFETQTEICPEELCQRGKRTDTPRHYTAFFADIAVIYLHMIAPPILQQKLPHFGAQWVGFGEFLIRGLKTWDEALSSTIRLKGWNTRGLQIEYFLSRLEKTSSAELHFIHVMLPHVPYEFLSSGHKYNPSPNYPLPDGTTMNNKKQIWTGEAPLILTSYHQYLQQIGYADQFLGRLKKKLELASLYDETLIIVTADHGVSFQRGLPRRTIDNRNLRDLLQVPMLVKLPGQREGRISERFVSGSDVLPTIVDVLGARVSWVMDGHSMLADEELSRTGIEIPGVGYLKADDIKGFPRLEWQVEHFGANTSLEHLSPMGPYQELVGQELNDLHFGGTAALQLKSEDFEYFNHVDLDSGFLPALFKGNIEGAEDQGLSLVIALNGRIWATTKTSEWDGKHNYFSVLLPPAAFKDGRNLIDVYLVEKKENTLLLLPLVQEDHKIRLQRLQDGRESLLFSDGRKVSVDTGRNYMDGSLGWLTLKEGMLVFEGWAADLVENQPASDVLIFKGEKLVWQVAPTYKREDVVKAFNRPMLLRSGYRAIVPLRVLESHSGDISVVAMSQDKRAFRIHIKEIHKELIRTTLAK